MQNERNMFPSSLGMDIGFMLDLEYADFHNTLESNRANPKLITMYFIIIYFLTIIIIIIIIYVYIIIIILYIC
jgi:hypothetical protein